MNIVSRSPRASDVAYEALRRDISTLRLAPGSVLNETALMRELGVGRTPVREALQRLAHERLVVVLPRQGTIVSELSLQDLQEIFEVRSNLEGLSARLAAARATPEELEYLSQITQFMELAAQNSNYLGLLEQDQTFHRLIARISRNSYLEELLERLNSQSVRFWYLSFTRAGRLGETVEEHRHIYEAIAARDGDAAEAVIRQHVENFKRKVVQTF